MASSSRALYKIPWKYKIAKYTAIDLLYFSVTWREFKILKLKFSINYWT